MQLNIKNYITQLGVTLSKIEVTNNDRAPLNFNDSIEEVVKTISNLRDKNKKVILIGNGGSASIANHIAVDLWKNGGIKAISFSDSSLLTCVSNDFGYKYVFEKPLEMFAEEMDVLIAISSSGKSENILNGVKAAKSKLCRVVTMSGFTPDNPLRSLGEINFYVPSNSYGYVEIAHSVLCHYFVDMITDRKLNG